MRTTITAVCLIAACVFFVSPAFADDLEFDSQEAVFDHLRVNSYGGGEQQGAGVEEAIGQFFEGGEETQGTFPASEIWEHDFSFRTSPPPEWGYSGRVFFRYSDDDISGVEKWEKELELNLNYGDWRSYFRVSDYNTFAYTNDPMRLEKARLRYGQDDWKMTVGSLGGLFGRGLMVSMYEDRTLDFDNEVEGAKIEYKLGDADVTALWGTRKNRTAPESSEITAARIEVPVNENITVGVHGAQVRFPYEVIATPEDHMMLDYDLYGATAQVKFDPITVYAETVKLERDAVEYGDATWDYTGNDGRGHYLNIGFNKSQFAFTAEFKDYKGISQPFSVAPPVRKWQEQATADPLDDKGYMYELHWSPFKNSSYFEFSYGQGNVHERFIPHTEMGTIFHSDATKRTSFIAEYWKVFHGGDHHTIGKLEMDQKLNNSWVATGNYEHERIYNDYAEPFIDQKYSAELAYRSLLNLIYSREETGETVPDKDNWNLFELKLKPNEQQEFNIVYGSRREGLVCSGGVCRLEPAFDGVKIDYLFRF